METPLKVFIAEDDVFISEELKYLLLDLGYEVTGIGFNLESSVECLRRYPADLALLDIKMHGEPTGLKIADFINKEIRIPFIFLTSFSDEATVDTAVQLNPAAYLVKPFTSGDIFSTLSLVKSRIQQDKEAVVIRDGWTSQKLEIHQILWIKVDDKYIEIYTDSRKYLERCSITDFMERIESTPIVRTHRSFAVNLARVDRFSKTYLNIGSMTIPVSRKYKEEVTRVLTSLL